MGSPLHSRVTGLPPNCVTPGLGLSALGPLGMVCVVRGMPSTLETLGSHQLSGNSPYFCSLVPRFLAGPIRGMLLFQDTCAPTLIRVSHPHHCFSARATLPLRDILQCLETFLLS